MSEQAYMKLKDAVKRPKLSKENINRENKHFKRVVDQYQKWCTSDGGYEETRETYENDIIECLERYDLDGFALAQYLSEYKYIEPDSELVHILEDVSFVKSSLETEMLNQWVKENFLTIPDDVVGKKVNVKQGIRKYENHYITGIKPETYQVTVSDKIDKNGGYIVGFENVTFL
jgi:hypothetical protein